VAAERRYAERFIVHADEKLTAFVELELAMGRGFLLDEPREIFQNSTLLNASESGGGQFPRSGSSPLPDAQTQRLTKRGTRK